MFDSREAFNTIREPLDGLDRAELEERRALLMEFVPWIDETEAMFLQASESTEAGK